MNQVESEGFYPGGHEPFDCEFIAMRKNREELIG